MNQASIKGDRGYLSSFQNFSRDATLPMCVWRFISIAEWIWPAIPKPHTPKHAHMFTRAVWVCIPLFPNLSDFAPSCPRNVAAQVLVVPGHHDAHTLHSFAGPTLCPLRSEFYRVLVPGSDHHVRERMSVVPSPPSLCPWRMEQLCAVSPLTHWKCKRKSIRLLDF